VSGFKQAAGGMHDPAPSSFRVEITVCCPRGHKLLPFYRSTLPHLEDEGVSYDRGRLGRFAELSGADYGGQDWRRIILRCHAPGPAGTCRYRVEILRERMEEDLGKLWAPWAKHRERVIWDSPG
jgi:hypothetical protein